ncbi:aryl-alcohol dehydrogenase-like predicted oxidoreductase [Lewinella marina]|uniref:Aldo/keto reductase n=1 Tax=Neolewinella marina TaxID=438751 RepID=A0A2G0CHR2_9BACT|nr:aldo/keto reductase [Neolewinella marina]NJB85374.1 aryl-alcohol dehydrogenase-like predicted oxidoreductase [Neolewinella marina]PHK99512.1 aldo/keto reductase [Neolewinella marina]
MQYRKLGKTNFDVSEISLGTWQVGGKWGEPFDDATADRILNEAIDQGVNFIDTADVYSDGRSEQAVGRVVGQRSEEIYVATKCGRQINPHTNENYTVEALRGYVEDSLKRLKLERIDLIQLHCPPTDVYYRPEIFELFARLKEEGKIRQLGVSVEKVEEAIKAMEYPDVATVQIIFNVFRQRPAELFFDLVREKNVGVIARVPLASGLLTGKFSRSTTFGAEDHRNFNRNGEAFDQGETFSGVDYERGLAAVDQLKELFPNEENLAPVALQWILAHPEVSCIIPGASRLEHLHSNLSVENRSPLTADQLQRMNAIYEENIKPTVHQRW